MRVLKRGTRRPDVREWQAFLSRLRADKIVALGGPALQPDGIFGKDTARSTVAFQQRFGFRPDGVVGESTYAKAKERGFEAVVVVAPPKASPPAPASLGNSRQQSFQRLRAEPWQNANDVRAGLTGGQAVFQLLRDGSGDYVYDEYSVEVEAMPEKTTPEQFLQDMLRNLNGTIKNDRFDTINTFERRTNGPAQTGEIIDIDILGPDNGSVALVALAPPTSSFRPSTVT